MCTRLRIRYLETGADVRLAPALIKVKRGYNMITHTDNIDSNGSTCTWAGTLFERAPTLGRRLQANVWRPRKMDDAPIRDGTP